MLKKLCAFKSSAEAGMIISLLKNNKFHPLDLQTSDHVSFAGADIYYYVQIPEGEYKLAKKFLIKQGYKDLL